MGRVSTLGRERLVALSQVLPSASESSRSVFNRPLSPKRSNLTVLCRHGSHLWTGLPARRKHGWSAAHSPLLTSVDCGVTLPKHTFSTALAVSVGVPARPSTAGAERVLRDSRPPFSLLSVDFRTGFSRWLKIVNRIHGRDGTTDIDRLLKALPLGEAAAWTGDRTGAQSRPVERSTTDANNLVDDGVDKVPIARPTTEVGSDE